MDDPRKLGLDDEMALVRAMIGDRLEDLDGLGSAKTWHQLKKTYGKMMTAQERREKQRFAQYLIEIGEIIDHGHDQTSTRQEIVKLIDSERKLIDTQRQLFIDMGEFITRGMVLLIMRRIMDSVTEEVRELEGGPEAIQSVADTIRGLAGSLRGGRSSTGSVTIDVEQEQLADR
jgi:nucleoside diphosphate kinase